MGISKVVELFCGDGSIEEAHCQKKILNLENTFQLNNRNHSISSQFHSLISKT